MADRAFVASRVIAHLFPEFLYPRAEFLHRHTGLEIDNDRDLASIDNGLDGIAAYVEAGRALDSPVREIQVALHLLNHVPIHQQADSHILKLYSAEEFPGLGQ